MKHKHAELIKAWADGAKIQYFSGLGCWNDIDYPGWLPTEEYRIKPEPREWVCVVVNDKLWDKRAVISDGKIVRVREILENE